MISFLQKNDGAIVLVAPVLLVLGSIIAAFTGANLFEPTYADSPFMADVFGLKRLPQNTWFNMLLTLPLVLTTAVTLNRGVHQHGLIGKLNNIPLLVSVIFFFTLPTSINHPLFWLCAFLVVQFLRYCMNILDDKKINKSVFNASIIGGFIALLVPMFHPMILTVLGVLVLTQHLTFRRLFLALLGMFLPLYFSVLTLYVLDTTQYLVPLRQSVAFIKVELSTLSLPSAVYIGVVLFGLLLASIHSKASTLRERRKWRFEIMLLGTMAVAFFYGGFEALIAATLIPAIIILSRALSLCEHIWLKRILFYSLLAMSLINLINP